MTLNEFLKSNKIKIVDFAKNVGVSRDAVQQWLRGNKLPRKENYEMIFKLTNGAVTPSDFYNLDNSVKTNLTQIKPKRNHKPQPTTTSEATHV